MIQITTPKFTAKIWIEIDTVSDAELPLIFMVGWKLDKVLEMCEKLGFEYKTIAPERPVEG